MTRQSSSRREAGIQTKRILVATFLAIVAGCASLDSGLRRNDESSRDSSGVQRMYVFNCGDSTVSDMSRWTPGVNVGQPGAFSANCYLLRHARGLMLWDSGISETVATMPSFQSSPVAPRYVLKKTLTAQLAEIGVKPQDVTHVAFSHTHGDHVGNANLFAGATWYVQQAEYDAMFAPDALKRFNFNAASYEKLRASKTVKVDGDHDVFGDGSVVLIATPGHTPGHQSLLVRLPKRGPVVLTGDMVHLQDNWTAKRVPSFNFDRDQSLKSMEKVAALMAKTGAELWINHDKAQSDAIPKAPAYVE